MVNKKILYIITKAEPFGGAQRYVFDLATNLPKEQFQAVVTLGEGKTLEEKLQKEGVRTIHLKNSQRNISPLKDFLLFFELLKIYRREKPDVIHLNSSKVGFLGSLAAQTYSLYPKPHTLNPKIIFTAHGWAFNDSRFFLSKIFWKFLQWLTVLLADQTIAVSEKTKNNMNWSGASDKIKVVYNGLPSLNFLEKTEARIELSKKDRRLENIPKDKIWIGTVSELHRNKGLDLMIEALSKIKNEKANWVFIVCGEGEEREKLNQLIHQKEMGSKIFLVGLVKNAATYLKALDIFTLTSRTEGLPYALLEAGAAGLPTIASNVGGIPEVIQHGKNGLLFEREDVGELKRQLEDTLGDEGRVSLFGASLQKSIAEKFCLGNMLKLTESIYCFKHPQNGRGK